MLKKADIEGIAKGRFEDSDVLFKNGRYDGSYYLCGYAIELGLKYRICDVLNWDYYYFDFQSFKTHDLGDLLKLSGKEKFIRTKFTADWNIVQNWNSEKRYVPIGSIKVKMARRMLDSSKIILDELL